MSQIPMFSLATPSQYPVVALVDNITGKTADLSSYVHDRDDLTSGESTMSRREVSANNLATGSGTLRLSYFTAHKTETINQLRLVGGTTAAGATPTLVRAGIYTVATNGDITLASAIANDTGIFAAASTSYTRSLTSAFSKVANTRYAVGILVVTGATAPTLVGTLALNAAEMFLAPRLSGTVTSLSDLPNSVVNASITNTAICPYAALVP